MEWDKISSAPGGNASSEKPGKGGISHTYPELEPVFRKWGITSPEDKEITITYLSELFQLAWQNVNSKEEDDYD